MNSTYCRQVGVTGSLPGRTIAIRGHLFLLPSRWWMQSWPIVIKAAVDTSVYGCCHIYFVIHLFIYLDLNLHCLAPSSSLVLYVCFCKWLNVGDSIEKQLPYGINKVMSISINLNIKVQAIMKYNILRPLKNKCIFRFEISLTFIHQSSCSPVQIHVVWWCRRFWWHGTTAITKSSMSTEPMSLRRTTMLQI